MSDAERAREAFGRHDAFESVDQESDRFRIETVSFEATVTVEPPGDGDDDAVVSRLTVRVPTLDAAVEEDVGPAVQNGWFETFVIRLEDAPGAVRDSVDLVDLRVREEAGRGEVVATFEYVVGTTERAPAVAKAFAEYAEGTYVQGIVPGYTYRGRVADLLSRARQGDGRATGDGGGADDGGGTGDAGDGGGAGDGGDASDGGGGGERGPMPL